MALPRGWQASPFLVYQQKATLEGEQPEQNATGPSSGLTTTPTAQFAILTVSYPYHK